MENRSFEYGASATPPAPPAVPSAGYPTNGEPSTNTPATLPGDWWFHQIGEELRAIITAAGLVPSLASTNQVIEAIERLIDAHSGNYALDTGVANAYVVALSPAITAYQEGLTIRVKAVNANTGAATLNAGGGVVSLANDVGGALADGDIQAGSIFTATFITSANKFYITSLVQSQGDGRYAKLAGLLTQVFSCAAATAGDHAVNRTYGDGRYAALAGLLTQVFSCAAATAGDHAVNRAFGDGRYAAIAQVHYVGTTAIPANRGPGGQTLTGVNIDGNSANGGVTSVNGQAGAVDFTSPYSIGSVIIGRPLGAADYVAGSTVAGSSLYTCGPNNYSGGSAFAITTDPVLINVGSWRCISRAYGTGSNGYPGIWIRYA